MASTYLSRTPASAGSQTTWTFSAWVKKSQPAANITQLIAQETGDYASSGILTQIRFQSDQVTVANFTAGNYRDGGQTTQKFRDISGWYHIVVNFNSTDATLSNRIKVYVNGEEAAFNFILGDTAQNAQSAFNTTDQAMVIGATIHTGTAAGYFDGSMTHVHFIDGTVYDADTFGETDATTGIWKPKTAPSVTYGTNGFFLKFENSAAFGTDSSGNANTFTVNGTMTQTIDTPSNVFATMNALVPTGSLAFSNGNTTLTGSNDTLFASNNNSTLGVSAGKYYAEVEYDTAGGNTSPTVGVTPITTSATTNTTGSVTDAVVIRMDNDLYVEGVTTSAYLGSTPSAGDIIGIALDLDNGKVWFSLNGTFVGDPVAGTGAAFDGITSGETMCFCTRALGAVFKWNFGNGYFGTTAVSSAQNPDDGIGIFEYDVPTGYRALCTKSINAEEYS
jgi:hypothetical protein